MKGLPFGSPAALSVAAQPARSDSVTSWTLSFADERLELAVGIVSPVWSWRKNACASASEQEEAEARTQTAPRERCGAGPAFAGAAVLGGG